MHCRRKYFTYLNIRAEKETKEGEAKNKGHNLSLNCIYEPLTTAEQWTTSRDTSVFISHQRHPAVKKSDFVEHYWTEHLAKSTAMRSAGHTSRH
jgi:hypothetical protein